MKEQVIYPLMKLYTVTKKGVLLKMPNICCNVLRNFWTTCVLIQKLKLIDIKITPTEVRQMNRREVAEIAAERETKEAVVPFGLDLRAQIQVWGDE